jgi:hypothetical protein
VQARDVIGMEGPRAHEVRVARTPNAPQRRSYPPAYRSGYPGSTDMR